MQIDMDIVARAIANGHGNGRPHGQPIAPAGVVGLLAERVAPGAQSLARRLLQRMAQGRWEVVAGLHQSPADGTTHVTVDAGGRRHLRLDARGVIFDITNAGATPQARRDGRPPPWMAPGRAPRRP